MKRRKSKARFIRAAAMTLIAVTVVFFGLGTVAFAGDEKPRLIAHGGGFIEGYDTTNSVEAVMQSIADGYQLIELDIDFSRDDKLIMIHDWGRTVRHYFGTTFSKKLSENEFEKILINGKFQTLTFQRLTEILDEAEDVRIITDVKGNNVRALSEIAEKYPDYVKRMIPQIYSYEEYNAVKELGYEDIILTLYSMPEVDYDELMRFIKNHDLFAVTVGNEHEYAIKDLKYKLAKDGILVYYHPVKDFETAARAMDNGVYGVYANRVIPADFDEPARSYYLLDDKVKLCELTLAEKSFKALKNVKIKNGAGKKATYFIDGEIATNELVADLAEGKHELKVMLTSDEKVLVELDYLLWSDDSYLMVLDKRYEYRMDEFKSSPDMREALDEAETVSEEVRKLLLKSLVVKAGEYYGYNDGSLLEFRINEEFLYTQKYINGSVISPFADCIKAVGAESIRMDDGRYVYVRYNGVRTMMQANTSFFSQDHRSNSLSTPLTISRDKIMAPGEIYKVITGREYIDNQELMILLPENVKAGDFDTDEIFSAAALLFDVKE